MRIFLFGNTGAMSILLPELLAQRYHIVGACSKYESKKDFLKLRIAYFLKYLGLYPRELNTFRPMEMDFPSVTRLCGKHQIPLHNSKEMNQDDFCQKISAYKPDIILMSGFHRKIPESVLALKIPFFNVHPSFLPYHKGGSPLRWSLYYGEDATGVSIHRVTEQFDLGEIAQQIKVNIDNNETLQSLEKKIYQISAAEVLKFLTEYKLQKIILNPQTEQDQHYEKSFKQENFKINPQERGEILIRRIKAFKPRFAFYLQASGSGQKYYVWSAQFQSVSDVNNELGQISRSEHELKVRVSNGYLKIEEFLIRGTPRKFFDIKKHIALQEGDFVV